MASSVTADTAALRAFAGRLQDAGVELVDGLAGANEQAGRVVLDATRPPRRSGALAASLKADTSRAGVAFASSARYWTFVHYGAPRRHIVARPFFAEALRLTTDDVIEVYARHVDTTLEGI